MNEAIRSISQEKDPAKIGLVISSIIIIGSLIPKIESSLFNLNNVYSFKILLIGISMFFFFMAIKVNMNTRTEKIGETFHLFDVLPAHYTPLSRTCFFISGVMFLIFILNLIGVLPA